MNKELDLSGKWSCFLGEHFDDKSKFSLKVNLPGTLDENQIGFRPQKNETCRPTRKYIYNGSIYLKKVIKIPQNWKNKNIFLVMERTRITTVWIDKKLIGSSNKLVTKQKYLLINENETFKSEFELLIKISNNCDAMNLKCVKNSHIMTEDTQTAWLGILGDFKLEAREKIYIDSIKLYPDIDKESISVKLKLNKEDIKNYKIKISIKDKTKNLQPQEFEIKSKNDIILYKIYDELNLWSEFNPFLYTMIINVEVNYENIIYFDEKILKFGMRKFSKIDSQFAINNLKTFLRGKNDCCIFPKTGYAPMNIEEWIKIFNLSKEYGINYIRFHSWCPPKAAFEAADSVGMYLQPELHTWNFENAFDEKNEFDYFLKEAKNIVNEYGSHPSFVLFSLGNELIGSLEAMEKIIDSLKKLDNRHLYSIGSNNFLTNPINSKKSDFWTTFWTKGDWEYALPSYGGYHVRGSTPYHTMGHINNNLPSTNFNYSNSINESDVPIISHEIGQYQIFPDYIEIKKFNGVLKATNLEHFKNLSVKNNILDKAKEYKKSSGKLSIQCYREEIEAALRTKGFGGFQLLDLQDYIGQGTALVGILDSFMDSKNLIEPKKWREFCCEVVVLLEFKKYIWENDECFKAKIKIANYWNKSINSSVKYSIVGKDNKLLKSIIIDNVYIKQGKITIIDSINFDLSSIIVSQVLKINIEVLNTEYKNSYKIWVYNAPKIVIIPNNIKIFQEYDKSCERILKKGNNVLLIPNFKNLKNCVNGAFINDFWCYPIFKKYNSPGTLGIYCNKNFSIFNEFITESYSEWQWWSLLKRSKPIKIDSINKNLEVIVDVIDNIWRQWSLGLIFETKILNSKILICSIDLLNNQDKPEFKLLLSSLLNYMNSENFNPRYELDSKDVTKLLYSELVETDYDNYFNTNQFG
jgi:hypothetical protein